MSTPAHIVAHNGIKSHILSSRGRNADVNLLQFFQQYNKALLNKDRSRGPTEFQFTNVLVAKAYDELFVPRIFEPWAKLLLDEVDLQPGETVLDVATGPGTVARLAAARVGPQGRVVGTDIAPPMLQIARTKSPIPEAAPIEYLESPAVPLAALSGTFDAVLCQQGLQFFPDRLYALREMHRALKPNGRVAIAVWAELKRNRLFSAYYAAMRTTVPKLASLIAAPFSSPSARALKRLAEKAGFRQVRLSTKTLPIVFEEGIEQVILSLSATPVAPNVAALGQDLQEVLFARVRREMDSLVTNGKVVGETTSNIIIATC